MKKIISKISILAASALIFAGCNAIDPSDVVNPNLSESALVGQPNSSEAWYWGLERQLAVTANNNLIISEIVSDNYVNTQTFFNQFLDGLNVDFQDDDIDDSQFHIGRMREMAIFGLDEILPNDANATEEQRSEFLFFRGLSHLLGGMYYKELPGSASGAVLSRNAHFDAAIQYFTESNNANANVGALIGITRAHYFKGDATAAIIAADAAIAADAGAGFVRYITFDPQNSRGNSNSNNYTVNALQDAMYDRGSFDDLQPLPSLDFLDPKFAVISANEDSKVPLLKIEEAHLIKAEAQQSQGSDGDAISTLTDVIGLVATRPVVSVEDGAEGRTEREPGSRPDSSDVIVDLKAGLVLYRGGGPVDIPSISGTSYEAADLAGLSGDGLLEVIYRMRQEIFIGEGMRSVDMGITYVISQNELLLNTENVTSPMTVVDLPPYLAAIKDNVDAITYDPATPTCIIDNDVTALIVSNKGTAYVCPFH
jgi:hypothetical protein